jgi:hypothetical protein
VIKAPIKPITLRELAASLELSQPMVSRIVNSAATTRFYALLRFPPLDGHRGSPVPVESLLSRKEMLHTLR